MVVGEERRSLIISDGLSSACSNGDFFLICFLVTEGNSKHSAFAFLILTAVDQGTAGIAAASCQIAGLPLPLRSLC